MCTAHFFVFALQAFPALAWPSGLLSWPTGMPAHVPPRCPASRACRVEGSRQGVASAVNIMCDAVGRYKELCEGKFAGEGGARSRPPCPAHLPAPPSALAAAARGVLPGSSRATVPGGSPASRPPCLPRAAGQSVGRIQRIGGVDFSYQPVRPLAAFKHLPSPPACPPAPPAAACPICAPSCHPFAPCCSRPATLCPMLPPSRARAAPGGAEGQHCSASGQRCASLHPAGRV